MNVYAGQCNFGASLHHSVNPNLNAVQVEGVPLEVKWKDLPSQPFVLPQNYHEQFPDVPDECLAKYIHNLPAIS